MLRYTCSVFHSVNNIEADEKNCIKRTVEGQAVTCYQIIALFCLSEQALHR